MIIICYQVLPSGRLSFSVLTEALAPLSAFLWVYTLVYAVINANKLWNNNNHTLHVNEIKTKTKPSTSHSNWPRVPLIDLAQKQYIGIIKG